MRLRNSAFLLITYWKFILIYRTQKNFGRGKLVNRELFVKVSSSTFTDTPKMYLAYAPTIAYSPKFSSPIAFTFVVCQGTLARYCNYQ